MRVRFLEGGERRKEGAKVVLCGRKSARRDACRPIDRKIQIMEAIWEDFRDRFDRLEVSQEQKDLLDRRRARVQTGTPQLLD
jgi:hypothetical protein